MASQVEAWFGKDVKIGFAKYNQTPATPYNDRWLEGKITNFKQSGGETESESVPFFGGAFKTYTKPQGEFNVEVEIIPTDTDFDAMFIGQDEWVADSFDSYASDAAVLTAWAVSGDANDVDRETTTFKHGRASAELNWATYSTGTATYTMDVSTTHGAVKNLNSIVGTPGAGANPTQGVISFWYYVDDSDALAELTTNGIEVRVGSTAAAYKGWYVLKSKLTTGWNFCIIDMSGTADTTSGSVDWSSIDKIIINLALDAGATGDTAFIDEIRIYDSDITTEMSKDLWRITFLAQTASSASSGEKVRWVYLNCKGVSYEPDFSAEDYVKGTLTFSLSATNSSGTANIRKEYTSDASEKALTTLANW